MKPCVLEDWLYVAVPLNTVFRNAYHTDVGVEGGQETGDSLVKAFSEVFELPVDVYLPVEVIFGRIVVDDCLVRVNGVGFPFGSGVGGDGVDRGGRFFGYSSDVFIADGNKHSIMSGKGMVACVLENTAFLETVVA